MFELSVQRVATLVLITHDMELAGRCGRNVRVADGLVLDGAVPDSGEERSQTRLELAAT